MSAKPTISELLLLFREGSSVHSQKILRALLADGTAWKRVGKPERLRFLSSLVFGRSPRPVASSGAAAHDASGAPPMRLGGRFDARAEFEGPADDDGSQAEPRRLDPGGPREARRDKLR